MSIQPNSIEVKSVTASINEVGDFILVVDIKALDDMDEVVTFTELPNTISSILASRMLKDIEREARSLAKTDEL